MRLKLLDIHHDADYIVSGDKDLTDLNQHLKTRIIKLVDFKLMMGFQTKNNSLFPYQTKEVEL